MNLTILIDRKLANVLDFICKHPLTFVSETDIHCLVTHELMQIPELKPEKQYPTKCTIGLNRNGKSSEKTYTTMRVHKEYGHAKFKRARSDIVILNPQDIKEISLPLDLKKDKKRVGWITPDYIFEFGTEKAANSEEEFRMHLGNDIEKANTCNKKGYVIHIQRNVCLSRDRRLLKNRAKYEGYLNSIREEVKKAEPTVKIVVLIIDIGNEGRYIGKDGKIKLFKDSRFKGVNQKNLKEELFRALQ